MAAIVCISVFIDAEPHIIDRIHADQIPALNTVLKAFGEGDGDVAAVYSCTRHANGDIRCTGRAEGDSAIICSDNSGGVLHVECAAGSGDRGSGVESGAVSGDSKRSGGGGGHRGSEVISGDIYRVIRGNACCDLSKVKSGRVGNNRRIGRLSDDFHIIKVEVEHVRAVEVAESDIDCLTSVICQVHGFLLPSTLIA